MKSLLALILLPAVLMAQAAPRITVSQNVRVSRDMPNVFHYEVLVAADPENGSHLIACSMFHNENGRFGHRTVVYTSLDAGQSWSRALVDSVAVGLRSDSYDPACTFGAHGAMHFSHLSPIGVYTSHDNGHSWSQAMLPAGEVGRMTTDRDFMIVDHSGGKYDGTIYTYAQMVGEVLDQGMTPSGITLWRSRDGGKSFERPVQRFPEFNKPQGWGLHPGTSVVLSDGTWAAVLNELQTLAGSEATIGKNANIKVITSTDGGESLNAAVTVANPFNASKTGGTMPMLAADTRSALFKDRMYAVWLDLIGGRFQLVEAYSSDHNKTWSTPRVVNDDLAFADTTPLARSVGKFSIAVNGAGVVGVIWEDRREAGANDKGHAIRFAASLDGGDTWTPSVKVSDVPEIAASSERWYASVNEKPWVSKTGFDVDRYSDGGHTIGIDADAAGVFHPIWADSRTGISQLWTATVKVDGTPVKFGSSSLASLSDLSDKIKIEVLGSAYDPATHRVSVRTRLRNLSGDTVTGTMKVRAILMTSEATTTGTAVVANAENGVSGTGAVWDFSSLLSGGALLPNATTGERTLEFELANLRPIGPGSKCAYGMALPRGLLHFEGQLLGSTHKTKVIYP